MVGTFSNLVIQERSPGDQLTPDAVGAAGPGGCSSSSGLSPVAGKGLDRAGSAHAQQGVGLMKGPVSHTREQVLARAGMSATVQEDMVFKPRTNSFTCTLSDHLAAGTGLLALGSRPCSCPGGSRLCGLTGRNQPGTAQDLTPP